MAERSINSRHLVLFDGDCGFCCSAVALIAPRDSHGVFRFAPLDSDEGDGIRATPSLDGGASGSLIVVPGGGPGSAAPLQKSLAVLFIVRHLEWPWPLLSALGFLPTRLLDWAYDQVARHRYMLSGTSETCSLPTAASGRKPAS